MAHRLLVLQLIVMFSVLIISMLLILKQLLDLLLLFLEHFSQVVNLFGSIA